MNFENKVNLLQYLAQCGDINFIPHECRSLIESYHERIYGFKVTYQYLEELSEKNFRKLLNHCIHCLYDDIIKEYNNV